MNHTSVARLAETYAETRAFLEDGTTAHRAEGAEKLQTAVPRTPKRHPKQLDSVQVSLLIAAYRNGLSAKAIAEEFGIHRTTVVAHLERQGEPKHDLTKLTAKQIDEARRLRDQGLSYSKIAERFGIDRMTVWRGLRR